MVNIEFDQETQILTLTYSDSVDLADFERFIQYLALSEHLPNDLKVLHDAGSIGSTLRMKDLLYLSKKMKQGTGRFNEVRGAAVSSNPLAVTLSKLYERLNMESNTKWKTFNSVRAAVAWLVEI